ncbi:proton-coupled folate transporter [Patella vulgata]|uniref:proton-coupled folate transporter n=1 Tax=Patella vulgata TaxID=6465 RepID=UPI0024A9D29D|nr:proton-coupled folate transporter [Patella vulgata]
MAFCCHGFRVTVEPIMFLYMMCLYIAFPALQALIYSKVCVHQYNTTFCQNLKNNSANMSEYQDEEDLVQSETSHLILMTNASRLVPSCIVVLFFLSPLVDHVSRKAAILITAGFGIAENVAYLLNSVYVDIDASYLLIGSISGGCGGSFTAMVMTIYSYTSNISTDEDKTVRIALVEAMIFLAGTIGIFCSGLMVDRLGFVFTFSFTTGLLVVLILYVLIWLPDVKPDKPSDDDVGCTRMMASRVSGIFKFIRKEREEGVKVFVGSMIAIILLMMTALAGERDIMYLYVRRHPLNWSTTMYGYLSGFENVLRGITLIAVMPVFKYKFHLKDTTLIILGISSRIVGFTFYSFGYTWTMFTGCAASLFTGYPAAGIRSSVSQQIHKDEHGRLFGLIASVESIAAIIATLIFNYVYPASLSFYPGFCFMLLVVICVLGLLITL